MFSFWNRKSDNRQLRKTRAQRRRESEARRARRRFLRVEVLEDRRLLAGVTVDTVADLSDGVTTSIADLIATPGTDGKISLREAITAANNTAGADTIGFDTAGIFATPQTITLAGTQLPTIIDALTITGTGAANLTVNANNQSRIFNLDDGNTGIQTPVELVAMTLTGGNPSGVFPDNFGGAIFSRESLTLRDSVVTGNSASYGGGIYSRVYSGGTTTIQNSTLSGNAATYRGGGIDSRNYGGTTTIQNSTLSGNSATYNGGGGINSVNYSGTTTIQNSTLSGNSVTYGSGGGIYSRNFGTTTIQNSTLSGNSATFNGGGGIHSVNYSGTTTIQNSTLSGNSVTYGSGGGIYSRNYGGTTNLTSSIVAGNTATASAPDLRNGVGTVTVTSSLIGDNTDSGLAEDQTGASGNFVGTAANPINPLLGPLADNGGPTQTMALLAGSPALDSGSNPAGLTTDQRGAPFLRDDGGGLDMGAFEAQLLALLVDINNDIDNGNFAPGDLSLREAIGLANALFGLNTIGFDTAGVFATPQTITLAGTQLPTITDALTITGTGAANLTISGNSLSRIFNLDDGNNTNHVAVELVALTLTGGNASGVFPATSGGAIVSRENLVLRDSVVTGNSASYGGGIYSRNFGTTTIQNSTLSGNSASYGGGIYSRNSGTTTIQNSTLSGNSASYGGGIYSRNSGTTTIQNSTLSGNSATNGGGIYSRVNSGGTTSLSSSIVAGNSATTSAPDLQSTVFTGTVTVTSSMIGDNTGSGLSEAQPPTPDGNGNLVGTAANPIDPLLGPLADNGGLTQTMALLAGSPALDRGSNPGALTTDQRGAGFPRVSGTSADMGAFEHQVVESLVVTSTVDENDGTSDPLFGTGTSLREAMLFANSQVGLDTISFNIPGAGPHVIMPATGLPTITDPVIIDGTSEPDFAGTPVVEIDGVNAGVATTVDGLKIAAGNSTVRGLAITRFGGDGIEITTLGGNTIQGNYVGIGTNGTTDKGNGQSGVRVTNTANNTIGGATLADSNVISGNATHGVFLFQGGASNNVVRNNRVGTNAAGTAGVGNSSNGVYIVDGPNNQVLDNTIAGNLDNGLVIENGAGAGTASDTIARGNVIGTNAAGTAAVANNGIGVFVINAANTTIGGAVAGQGNLISGNGRSGIVIQGSPATGAIIQGNNIGLTANGATDIGNASYGVWLLDAPGATVGGAAAGQGNIVSGNNRNGVVVSGPTAAGNVVSTNFIGVDITGLIARGNSNVGVWLDNSPGATVESNVIASNGKQGVLLSGLTASGNVVRANLIGTAANGTTPLGNTSFGVWLLDAPNNTIGGTTASDRNVIADNSASGIAVTGVNAFGNVIQGNSIGTDAGGTINLGNTQRGIQLLTNAHDNTIGGTTAGAGNTIAFNGGAGVWALIDAGVGNAVLGNSMFSNAGVGIDLGAAGATANDASDPDTGPNLRQNTPVMTVATRLANGDLEITFSVDSSVANAAYPLRVEFFLADVDNQEGQTFLGSVSYAAPGAVTNTITPLSAVAAGQRLVATATDDNDNTSEFSANITVAAALRAAGGENRDGNDGSDGNNDPCESIPFFPSVPSTPTLTSAQLAPTIDAAFLLLAEQGFSADQLAALSNVEFVIADLPTDLLGLATDTTITIDVNAAGYGWFIDPTPLNSDEFSLTSNTLLAIGDSAAAGYMDLLTAVLHELSHLLGHDDLDSHGDIDDLMYGELDAGLRKVF